MAKLGWGDGGILVKQTLRTGRKQQSWPLKRRNGSPKSAVTVFLCGRLSSSTISSLHITLKGIERKEREAQPS